MAPSRKFADAAAASVANTLGITGPVVHLSSSLAATYAAGAAVLRVVPDGIDADGTLAVAAAAGRMVRVARPLRSRAICVTEADSRLSVEVYERIHPTRLATATDLGEALALLHTVDLAQLPSSALSIRPATRLGSCRESLAASVADPTCTWHDVATATARNLESARELCASLDTPQRLVHLDASTGNLLVDRQGPVWIDWEGAGVGPAALDVALAAGEMWRFHGPAQASQLLNAYWQAGGCAPPDHVALLSGVRDWVGVAELFPVRRGASWARLARQRFDSVAEAVRTTRWEPLSSL